MKLKSVVLGLSLAFWPVVLFLANTPPDLLRYAIPVVLLLLALKYYRSNSSYYFLPLVLIPLIEPKLALFPLMFVMGDTFFGGLSINKSQAIFLLLSVAVFASSFIHFRGQSIFVEDYEARQMVIRNQKLYPHPYLSRTFHNKAKVVFDKANQNFFEMIDPGNYLFGFAPRQVIERGQNLNKFPFLALPFFALGVYFIRLNRDKKYIFTAFFAGITSLAPLTLYDRHDFILYVPLSLILIQGLNLFDKKVTPKSKFYYLFFIFFSTIELFRSIIQTL